MLNFTQNGIEEALLKIIENVDMNEPFRVLSIGSGSGETDLRILHTMADFLVAQKKKRPTIQTVIVEPNKVLLDQFKMKVSSHPSLLESAVDISFEWHQRTFDGIKQESKIEKNSFDLIHFVHSIYFTDVEAALRLCFAKWLKEENGAVICFVKTEDSYFAEASKAFKGKLSLGSEVMAYYTDQDLIAIAEKYGWKYCVPAKQQFHINVTPFFQEQTSDGDPLMDFLTHQQNFRANAEQELFNSWIDFIDSLAFTNESGEKLIKGENAAVIIYK